jgi:hypothetical protein
MKVGHLMYLTGMPKQVFDNLARRGHLDFLEKGVGEGVDRFTPVHALALAVFWSMRRLTVDAGGCSGMVEANWDRIARVASGQARPSDTEIGIQINSLGCLDDVAWPMPEGTAGRHIVKLSVNLAELNDDVSNAIKTIE